MVNTQRLLEHIASFTSHRDLELLVISLLKSTCSLLKPVEASIVKLDAKKRPIKKISCVADSCQVSHEGIVLLPESLRVIDQILAEDLENQSVRLDNGYLVVYQVEKSRRGSTYLFLNLPNAISEAQELLISGVLGIYRNFSALLLDAQTDKLTGLANRSSFDLAVSKVFELLPEPEPETEYSGDRRFYDDDVSESTYWLAILDIDHFKKVNDTYGHLFGDEVLVQLARLMRESFREDDMLFRFGGEEFVVVLRSPTKEACDLAVERFRCKVEDATFPGVGRITVSIGVVQLRRDTFHATLLDYADQALYHSKVSGRNQRTFFDDLVAMGKAQFEKVVEGETTFFD